MVWNVPGAGVRFTIFKSSGLTGYGVIDSEDEVKWQVHQDGVRNATDSYSFSVFFDVLADEAAAHEFYLMGIYRRGPDKDDYVEGIILQENVDASFSRLGWFTAAEGAAGLFLETEQREIVLV